MVLNLVMMFEAHQPYRIKSEIDLSIEDPDELIDRELDRLIINRVVEKCYSPALDVIKKSLLEASERYGWRYSIGMSISGTLIEQLEETNPQVLEKIRELVSLDLLEIDRKSVV